MRRILNEFILIISHQASWNKNKKKKGQDNWVKEEACCCSLMGVHEKPTVS